ncbi:MAG: YWFCY domain-containing protein, partial [Chitinophagaceae bacterium]|nr:YWFCY domain-containing protein [Chitinophagaceae bacterium]
MNTGENEQALRKIMDLTRLGSVLVLGLHFYYECYRFFVSLAWQTTLTDRILTNLAHTGLFGQFAYAKALALVLLIISLLGVKAKKQEKLKTKTAVSYLSVGLLLFWCSGALFRWELTYSTLTISYLAVTSIGFLLILTGGVYVSRIIRVHLNDKDIFNRENETFPQEERLLENQYSINLPAEYYLRGKKRKSWINIINPFRGVLVMGTPGSGKSYFFIEHVIRQHIRKGFAMLVYDFKFDDLSRIAYNTWVQNQGAYKNPAKCYFIDFERIIHRCNPLEPASMNDITDAAEAARTILLGLNREWIKKQGDFFVESPINFLTAIIWYLRKYNDGEFCTLPHVIELMQVDYDRLFTILRTEKEIEALINPFVSAYLNDVMEQLEGQIAAAKISMARLVSPQLYYVMSGNDFTLDINNPEEPKIVCLGNNPQKQQVYGAVLSLYVSRLIKTVNKKGKLKCSLVFDEFPTIYLNNIDSLIATARSNLVATTLGIQDFSQLKKDYGKDQADVI